MRRWMWGCIVIFFVLYSLVPTFYEIGRRNDLHENRYFELVHNFYTDYNFYLSRIRQGREGAWTVQEKYTSEPHEGSYLQIMYVLMGKVSSFVRVPWPNSGDTYHIARVVLACTLLFLFSYTAKTAFINPFWQVMGFLLIVIAGTWPILVYHKEEWRFGGYMPWWTIMDALQRITFIPHMLAGQAFIVFHLVAMTTYATMKRAGNWIFLGVLAFVFGIIFPPGLLFVFAVYGMYFVINLLYTLPFKTKNDFKSWAIVHLGGPAVIGIISAPSLLYLSLVLRVYPWKRLIDFAVLHPQPFKLTEYILAVGPMLPLGVIGALLVLIQKEKKYFLFVSWVITWFALIIIFQYVPQESPLRFTEMLPQVPLGILAAYLFYRLYVFGVNIIHNKKIQWHIQLSYGIKLVSLAVPTLLVVLGICQMYGSWRWQMEFVDHKIVATMPLVPTGSYVMYPLKDFVSAILFIQDATPRSTVILSETTAGNYIPVYSGNTVYVGHANTINTEQKESIVADFFSGRMGVARAKQFLTENNLHYIFFGPQEMDDGGLQDLARAYPFLREIYTNPSVRIYSW
jgi:MFS family permease